MHTTSPAIEGAGEQIGESSAPVAIQRYHLFSEEPSRDNPFGAPAFESTVPTGGDWVKYADHLAAIMNPTGQRLTKDDAATFKLIQHLLDTIATEEQDPLFCGFQYEEMRTQDGMLMAVRLVACDGIGGIAAPRAV